MESKTPPNVSTDSTLPPSFEEVCKSEPNAASSNHIRHEERSAVELTVDLKAGSACETLPEKSPPSDEPLNADRTTTIYNADGPPPYEADPLRQGVWSTETSNKLHLEKRRTVGRNNRRLNVVFWWFVVLLSGMVGMYLCFQGFSSIVSNDETTRKLISTVDEIRVFVTEVDDIWNVPVEYEGKLVHVVGPLKVETWLESGECDVMTDSVKLRRQFDRSYVYNKDGSKPYFWSEKWADTRLALDRVCIGTERPYRGPVSTLRDEEKIASRVRIGSMVLGERLKQKFDDYVMIKDKLFEIADDRAIRVMYSVAGMNGVYHSVLGQWRNGAIEPYPSLEYYDIILQAESTVSAEKMAGDRVNFHLTQMEAQNRWSYATIALGVMIPFIAMLRYDAVLKAAKKNKPNDVMLSSQQA